MHALTYFDVVVKSQGGSSELTGRRATDLLNALTMLVGSVDQRLFRAWSLVFIIFVAFCLRLFHLTENSLWLDEGLSISLASSAVAEIIDRVVSIEKEPLYYLLLHGWMNVAGQSEWALRYLSVLLGVTAVPLVYIIGRVLGGHRVGLLSAGLEAVSPLSVWYAQEVGRFTLGLALTLTATWMLVLGIQRRRTVWWVAYGLTTAASLYTIYTAIGLLYLQVIVILTLLLFYEDNPGALAWRSLLSCGVIIAGFGPWIPSFLQQTRHAGGASLFHFLRRLAARLGLQLGISRLPIEELTLVALVIGLLAVVLSQPTMPAIARMWQRHKGLVVRLGMLLYVPLLTAVAWHPVSSLRLFVPLMPYGLLTLAFLLSEVRSTRPRRRWLAAVMLGSAVSLAVLFFGQQKEDWRSVAQLLQAETNPQDVILLQPGYVNLPLDYYYDGLPSTQSYKRALVDEWQLRPSVNGSRLWLVTGLYYLKYMDPRQVAYPVLDARLPLLEAVDFAHVNVRLYSHWALDNDD